MLPQSGYAMTALEPGAKDTEQYEPRTQHEANPLHARSLAVALMIPGKDGRQE